MYFKKQKVNTIRKYNVELVRHIKSLQMSKMHLQEQRQPDCQELLSMQRLTCNPKATQNKPPRQYTSDKIIFKPKPKVEKRQKPKEEPQPK